MKKVGAKGNLRNIDSLGSIGHKANWVWQFRSITDLIRHFLGGYDKLSSRKDFGSRLPGIVLLHFGSAIVISTHCCLNVLK